MPTVRVTDKDFQSVVLESKQPVLVDFWATWCAPCKVVAPVLEELSDTYAGALTVAKVDVDESRRVAAMFRIRSIPTLMLFKDGEPIQAVEGALPKQHLEELLAKWLPELAATARSTKLNVPQLFELLKKGRPATIIDIRRPFDFARSHLRGALNVAADKVEDVVRGLGPRGLAVLMCRTGEESESLAKSLSEKGLSVVSLEKGLLEWEGAGHPTFSTEEEEEELAKATKGSRS
ncbi:MAG: thioredoxin [Deltaproteobacteria bacterium]|nr:thioredoxin [Deltaproteobacteria bacterium]